MTRTKVNVRFAARVTAVVLGVILSGGWDTVEAQQGTAPANQTPTVVLDTYGIWRMHATLAPPVLTSGESVKLKYVWLNYKTPGPAKDWMKSNFDDYSWNRGPATLACKTALVSKLCLRGKFTVTDPSVVKNLRLSVSYRGGLIVYLNGRELHREHIGRGKSVADGLAGKERNISALSIPKKLLRKGMNVIGLEIVRAPHAQASDEDIYEANGCEILHVRLTSRGASGLIPNVVRPQGLQVWNADILANDLDIDWGDRAEPLRPVRITGARNGLFSGKVLVGSTKPIRGLKVTPGAIKGQGGTIPASNVRIRYGILWGGPVAGRMTKLKRGLRRVSPYPTYAHRLTALAEEPLDEFEVATLKRVGSEPLLSPQTPGGPKAVPGAVVPVWITVKVPADVKAGTYTGKVRIEADGEKPVTVPVEVKVADWTLPDTQDYRTWVDLVQCPDTSALEYSVPLWSDEHFKMVARSFRLIGETGSRIVYVPLLAHTNLGNEESMVRWVKKGDKFEYDFSTMERYLDVAEKNMGGKPKLVVFLVWDVYMIRKNITERQRIRDKQHTAHLDKIGAEYGQGPMVTVFNPATQKTELTHLPAHSDKAASKPLWKPLMDELRKRMKKRGLEKEMMLGLIHDSWPTKEEIAFFHDIAPDVPWVVQSHEGCNLRRGTPIYGISRVGYQAVVWPVKFSDDGADRRTDKGKIKSLCGWKRKDLVARFIRSDLDRMTCTGWRHYSEWSITGDQRGKGRIGADYWKVLRNKKGDRIGRTHERYPESNWRNLIIRTATMAPGPTGPVATNRMDAFREGVQECEARITIERAIYDDALKAKLGPDLTKRCEEYLHARHMTMWLSGCGMQLYYFRPPTWKWRKNRGYSRTGGLTGHNWFLGSDWQERTAQLFSLAGEVTRKLAPQ